MHVLDLLLWLREAGAHEEIFSETNALLDLAVLQLDPACSWARVETSDGPVLRSTPSDLGARWGWTTTEVEVFLDRLERGGRLERRPFGNGEIGCRLAIGDGSTERVRDLFPNTLAPRQGFMGRVIQLDARALEMLRHDYPNLRDIRAELATLDAYYAETLAEGQRHSWRFRYRQALNKRNHACAGKGGSPAVAHAFGPGYRPLGGGR